MTLGTEVSLCNCGLGPDVIRNLPDPGVGKSHPTVFYWKDEKRPGPSAVALGACMSIKLCPHRVGQAIAARPNIKFSSSGIMII